MSIGSVGARGPEGLRPQPDLEPAGAASAAGVTTGADRAGAPARDLDRARLERYPDLVAVYDGSSEMARGASGESVRWVQEELYRAGFEVRGGFDGAFGRGTESAVAAFQRSAGLTPSGRLDQGTLQALASASPKRVLPAPEPLTADAQSYLTNDAERESYTAIERKLWTGSSWRRGIDLAVSNDDARAILDRLDALEPASYSRVLHALAATPIEDGTSPTLLDKLIRRGTSQAFNVRLSERFGQQLIDKLGDEPEPTRKILRHVSPDNVDRMRSWSSWGPLVRLLT